MGKLSRTSFRKRHKTLCIVVGILLCLVVIIVGLPLSSGIPKVASVDKYDGENAHITFDERCKISAHRAGSNLAPENTLSAFKLCVNSEEYRVDILEFDLHLTKDGELVLLHDDTLDRTSDAIEFFGRKKVYAYEKTYSELRLLNMAENFCLADGTYPYRGLRGEDIPADCRIVSLVEIFTFLLSYDDLDFIIEIKDDGERGELAADKLYACMKEFGLLKRCIVGTFNGSVSDYLDEKYPDVTRSAGIGEVFDFYFSSIFGVNLDKKEYKFDVLQIPYKSFVLNLGKKSIVDYAHHYGLAVQYWTINDKEDIEYLVSIGADAIITDAPDVADSVIYRLNDR